MANVGSLGGIKFNTSMRRVLTFHNYSRSGQAKFSTHDIIGKKSRLEYTGLDPEELTIEIQLMAGLRSKPEEELKKLRKMRDDGEVVSFIIGSKPVSQNKWVIQGLSEAVLYWGPKGKISYATVNVTLKEYIMSTVDSLGAGAATPWGETGGQIQSYRETMEEVNTELLDFLDDAEDELGVNL